MLLEETKNIERVRERRKQEEKVRILDADPGNHESRSLVIEGLSVPQEIVSSTE